jgi:hypothetical protein
MKSEAHPRSNVHCYSLVTVNPGFSFGVKATERQLLLPRFRKEYRALAYAHRRHSPRLCRLERLASVNNLPSVTKLRSMSLDLHRSEPRLATGQTADLLELRLFFRTEGMVIFSL